MNNQYQYDGRGDGRERRDDHNYQQQHHHSPPHSSSPFAFAPPPLTSTQQRPPLPLHHSEPVTTSTQQCSSLYKTQSNEFPYSSAPMGYRSISNDSQRGQPLQSASLTRTSSLNGMAGQQVSIPSQSSPGNTSPYPSFNRQPYSQMQQSQRPPVQPYYSSYNQATSADMPRSLSYPSSYTQQTYPTYYPSMSTPSLAHPNVPPLARHNTTSLIGEGMAGMDLGRSNPGYSFANRLPLVDRPFKCDECVQSFNRNHDLKRHKRIHLAVKPFGCDKCGKTFSRKDALRRHWLVKGCRGEEGATAPIIPLFPITGPPPSLSPPSPPPGNVSPPHGQQGQGPALGSTLSFSHPSAPPPLNTLPTRQVSDQSLRTVLVTPSEVTQTRPVELASGMEEPMVVDQSMGIIRTASNRGSDHSDGSSGYFDGVVGVKQDGTAMIDKSGTASPYSRYPSGSSENLHPNHPYRRPGALSSPNRASPTTAYNTVRSYSPSGLAQETKPVFAMPFAPSGGAVQEGLLAPPMEKQMSSESDPTTWQRWHRPSFPFPAPPGVNYNYAPSSPVEVAGPAQNYQ